MALNYTLVSSNLSGSMNSNRIRAFVTTEKPCWAAGFQPPTWPGL